MPECVVNQDRSIDCSTYVLGGVGNTNATVNLDAAYSATIDCTNKGGNLVESHTTSFADTSTATVSPDRNGQLTVPAPDRYLMRPTQRPIRRCWLRLYHSVWIGGIAKV
jgi:hypothetical protein